MNENTSSLFEKPIKTKKGGKVAVNSLNNLKPFTKGHTLSRQKRSISVKRELKNLSTTEEAAIVARDIIDKAVSGSLKHQMLFIELLGDFDNKPDIQITNNTLQIDVIALAREYAMHRLNNIIDAQLLPVSSSVSN